MARRFKHLSLEQRIQIQNMKENGHSVIEIANSLGVHRATIYNELKRGTINNLYNPYYSQETIEENLGKGGPQSKLADEALARFIASLILNEHLSPEKIVNLLKADNQGFSDIPRTPNTIYNAIDKGLIPGVTRECLNTSRSKLFNGGQISLPKWVLEKLDLKDGDTLDLTVTNDGKIIYQKRARPKKDC